MRHLALAAACTALLASGCGVGAAAAHADRSASTQKASKSMTGAGGPAAHPSSTSSASKKRAKAQGQATAPSHHSYPGVRQALRQALARSPIPVYMPLAVPGLHSGNNAIDARYDIKKDGYQVTVGFGPPLPLNSPKAQFGMAELLMTVIGTGPKGSLHLGRWIPLPKPAPTNNAAQGEVSLGHGIVGTNFTGGVGQTTVEAVTWHEGGWTFWVGPWRTSEWGNVDKLAQQQAAKYLHRKLPGQHGIAVFAGGIDAPSEAVFSIRNNRYAVEALGDRAAQFAAVMAPTAGGF